MTTPSHAPQKRKITFATILRGVVDASFSIVPLVSGVTLLSMSSAALSVTLGIAALGLGVYHSVLTVQNWRKPQAPKPSGLPGAAKVKEWLNSPAKRKSFKLKALITSAMGAVKLATGMTIAANLGAVSTTLSSGFAMVLSVFGAVTAIGGALAFGAFAILTLPKCLNKINSLLDKRIAARSAPAAKPATPSPSVQPDSKLGEASAKTSFDAAAKPATNDNADPSQARIAKPKDPAA